MQPSVAGWKHAGLRYNWRGLIAYVVRIWSWDGQTGGLQPAAAQSAAEVSAFCHLPLLAWTVECCGLRSDQLCWYLYLAGISVINSMAPSAIRE